MAGGEDGTGSTIAVESAARKAKRLRQNIIGYLRMRSNRLIVANVYIVGSRWECDVCCVTDRRYFAEYEIKISRSDFFNDAHKAAFKSEHAPRKHDIYRGTVDAKLHRWREVPRPRQFYFVTPPGLIALGEVPSHCGLIEIDTDIRARGSWGVQIVRRAPCLKKPTQLSDDAIFNLAVKASSRVSYSVPELAQ